MADMFNITPFIERRLPKLIPVDLQLVLDAIHADWKFEASELNPVAMAGARFLWLDNHFPPTDHSYLTEDDRANKDIMANVKAMDDTAVHLRFFAQLSEGRCLGYWPADLDAPLAEQVLYQLDTEGQYSVAEGGSLAETLSYGCILNGDEAGFDKIAAAYERLGLQIAKLSEDEIYDGMDARDAAVKLSPSSYRNAKYEAYKQA